MCRIIMQSFKKQEWAKELNLTKILSIVALQLDDFLTRKMLKNKQLKVHQCSKQLVTT